MLRLKNEWAYYTVLIKIHVENLVIMAFFAAVFLVFLSLLVEIRSAWSLLRQMEDLNLKTSIF